MCKKGTEENLLEGVFNDNSGGNFPQLSIKNPILWVHMLWVLGEALLMSTHNICFYGEIRKQNITELSPNTP